MKLKNNITLLLLVTTISCCHDFLGERPLSSVTDGISFETEHMLEANMRGIYNSLSYMTTSTWLGYLGYASRLEVWRGSTRTDFEHEQCHELCLGAKSSANESIYLSIYSSINMCNTLIDGLKDSPVNESYKEEIYGEALFMRAFFYFQLVRLYGNVPLILNQCRNTGDANVARTRYDIVYKAILDDLDKAFKMMRSQSRQLEVNPGADRPINMAAKVLMAQVYAQIGSILDSPEDQAFGTILDGPLTPDFTCCGIATAGEAWTEALKLEEEVIKSDVYALEPDYRNLFRWDSRNHPTDFSSKERILTLSNTIESGTVHMSSWTVWDYPDGIWSKTPAHSSNHDRIRPNRWIWKRWSEIHGGTQKTVNDYNVWSAALDPRLSTTIQHTEYKAYESGTTLKTMKLYPADAINTNDNNLFFRKYFSPAYIGTASEVDLYIIRYADVYLTAAEAAASIGETEKAIGYMNELLARARNSTDSGKPSEYPAAWKESDFSSKEEIIDAIMMERIFETLLEGSDWFNIHRRGAGWIANNITIPMNDFIDDSAQEKIKKYSFGGKSLPESISEIQNRYFCEFPDYEFRYNPVLSADKDQNYYSWSTK